LNAISETNEKLDAAGLLYESYLQIWDVNCFILLLQAI